MKDGTRLVKTFVVALLVLLPAAAIAQETGLEEAAHKHEPSEEARQEALEKLPPKPGPEMSSEARLIGDAEHPEEPVPGSFGPDPSYDDHVYSPEAQRDIWGAGPEGKHMNPMTTPPVLIGRRLYDRGAYKTRATAFGKKNPMSAHFMAYGDLRIGAAYNDNGVPGTDDDGNLETSQTLIAARLNLDLDIKLTATERIHAFVRPFDTGSSFTRYEIDGKKTFPGGDDFIDELDFQLDTLFFEGDVGSIASGWSNDRKKYDLPIAFGLVPMVTQNGVWIEDAFIGGAFAITAKNSPKGKISNYDFTFFIGIDEVHSDAVRDEDDAKFIGFASFMDLAEGYLEYGYAYVDEDVDDFSYHNLTVAFSKRYWGRISNSFRLIANVGQDPIPGRRKTADGFLLLIENSWIGSKPSTLVPYFNFFYGVDTPQSLARDPGSGGVLRNTGIIFETDGLTGYPTLDARGHDAFGGSFGVNYLFNLNGQFVVEGTYLDRHGDLGQVLGSEYGVAIRYQKPLNNAWIVRLDALNGWRDPPLQDITAARVEIRRKF